MATTRRILRNLWRAGETFNGSAGKAMDHDALFKWLLKDPVILRSFFEEFLPEVADCYETADSRQ